MVDENLRYLEYIIENEGGSNKVAAVLVEPVVGSNGIIPAPPRYLEGVRRLCDQWGLLMIVDETMTGMGRTGRLFAIQHSGVEPDILIMGKALGAYCPLTATVFSEKVSRSFDDHLFGHGQSYSGHALGCAGALAALEVLLEDGVLEAVDEKGSYLEERLQNLAAKHPCVGDVRGLGLFYTMELVADPQTRQPLRKSTEKYSPTVIAEVLARGDSLAIELEQLCRERLGLALGDLALHGELALEIPVAGADERHPLAFPLDHDSGGHGLHAAGRQPGHDLLPQHR